MGLVKHKIHLIRLLNSKGCCRRNYSGLFQEIKSTIPKPTVNLKQILDNLDEYKNEVRSRKNTRYEEILSEFCSTLDKSSVDPEQNEELMNLAAKLPNWIHPSVKNYTNDFEILKVVGEPKEFPFKPQTGTDMLKEKDLLIMEGLNHYCGERSYYFVGDLVKLDQALIDYSVQKLLQKNFIPISVPDILHENVINNCGMTTKGERTQVYRLDSNLFGDGLCLSGTSEMSIAASLMNSNIPKDELPLNYVAVSRCYRAEISALAIERGLYRVHQFTKIEMFGVCLPHQSIEMLEKYRDIQEEFFSSYDLSYRVIDMAPHELGCQANRKFDIEAWMPGTNRYGEISSCSDCTDFQSRRLNIKSGDTFLHTVNGTACAIPRTVNAIAETHQTKQGRVIIPEVLLPFIDVDTIGMRRGPKLHNVLKNRKKILSSFQKLKIENDSS
ncbi:serine--tRNA ligase, mitochondrial-like isoform X1 [Planococcus citri]|uniref:serine--tRNA ligase, mitochondrial-like isoform X1 n=2 Tax=Planococcus citri TaxID=170843 RepID=UPI0031F96BA0